MVSWRRYIVSTLWMIRKTRWLSLLLTLVGIYAAVFLLPASVRFFKAPLHKVPKDTSAIVSTSPLNDKLSKEINQKNYKLAWVGQGDSYFTSDGQREEKKGDSNKEGIQSDKLTDTNIHYDQDSNKPAAIRRKSRRKFLFVFRYYEQLGRATNNLLELASWAKYRDSLIVSPFVNNSRMSGLPTGVSHYLRATTSLRFCPLSEYFDLEYLNGKLQERGYGALTSFGEFESECNQRLNIVVHFLFSNDDAMRDAAEWYRKSYKEMKIIYSRTRANGGWMLCPFVRHSRLQKQLHFKVSRYVCVDPEIIRSPVELEEKVLKGRFCVGVVLWKGNGRDRAHFPLHPSISQPLLPPHVQFNPTLVRMAHNFVREKIGLNFIAIHVRSERHIKRKGMNITYRCARKLITRVREAQKQFKITKLFLASDLPEYGSDTFTRKETEERKALMKFLVKGLKHPTSYKPVDVYDTGAIAIIEMNILAAGRRLYTLGGGNFQNWMLSLFLQRHDNDSRKIHRLCELS